MSNDNNGQEEGPDWVDPSQFRTLLNSEGDDVRDRPDEYLPGTDPFKKTKGRTQGKTLYGSPTATNSAAEDSANRRVDDWLGGGSPQGKAKRSWKVKAKTSTTTLTSTPNIIDSPSPVHSPKKAEAGRRGGGVTESALASAPDLASSSPTGRRWKPPAKSEAALPPWASPRSEPSKPRSAWKPKINHTVPPPVNRTVNAPDDGHGSGEKEKAGAGAVQADNKPTVESPRQEQKQVSATKQHVPLSAAPDKKDKLDEDRSSSTDHTQESTEHPCEDAGEVQVHLDEGIGRFHLHDDHKEKEEDEPLTPRVEISNKTTINRFAANDDDDDDDDGDDKRPDPAMFKLMFLQDETDRVDEYLPGSEPKNASPKKKKNERSNVSYGGGYRGENDYSGTSRVDDWLGSSPNAKPKRSWKPKS